jgi:hypothetical protein
MSVSPGTGSIDLEPRGEFHPFSELRNAMPDTASDLATLTKQVKALGGDVNRRFEQSSERFDQLTGNLEDLTGRFAQLTGRLEQLTGRLDTITVSHKVSRSFNAAMGGDWLGGATSPQVTLPFPGSNVLIAAGSMSVVLPDLSRIAAFRTSVIKSNLSSFPAISLVRVRASDGGFELVCKLPILQSTVDRSEGSPIGGMEFVDNDSFTYAIFATASATNPSRAPFVLPQGSVVLQTFEIDCVVA